LFVTVADELGPVSLIVVLSAAATPNPRPIVANAIEAYRSVRICIIFPFE
jgi:hypothetical protein